MFDVSTIIIISTSWLTLFAHILIAILVFLLIFNKQLFFQKVSKLIADFSLHISFVVAIVSIVGSLMFSSILGFDPCVLCWIQRIFIFPLAVIYAIALYKRDRNIFAYTLPLSIIGGLVALYHTYALFGGISLTNCTAVGANCLKIYFMEFGYITIPVMSLTAFIFLIVISFFNRRQS